VFEACVCVCVRGSCWCVWECWCESERPHAWLLYLVGKKSRQRHYSKVQQAISRYVCVELKSREGAGFLKKNGRLFAQTGEKRKCTSHKHNLLQPLTWSGVLALWVRLEPLARALFNHKNTYFFGQEWWCVRENRIFEFFQYWRVCVFVHACGHKHLRTHKHTHHTRTSIKLHAIFQLNIYIHVNKFSTTKNNPTPRSTRTINTHTITHTQFHKQHI